MGFSHRSYLLASVNFYIFLLSLSAYINKPKAFTNTHLPASKKFDKVLILSFSRYSERRKRVVSSLSRLSENPGEITLSAAAVQQRVITNSNGCFYINGRLWRPLNEEIAGVKHLWKCHLRKRKGGERKRRRRERGRRGRFFFYPGRYLQGSAAQLSISDQWLSFENSLFKALFGYPGLDGALWTNLHQDSIPAAACWSTSVRFERHGMCDERRIEIQKGENARTRGPQRTECTAESNIENEIREGDSRRNGEEKGEEALTLNIVRGLLEEKGRWKIKGGRQWKRDRSREREGGKGAKQRINKQGGRGRRKCCSSISAKQRESSGALNLAPIRGLMTVWSERLKRAGAF